MCIQKIEEGQNLRDKIMYWRKTESLFEYTVLWCDQIRFGGGWLNIKIDTDKMYWTIYYEIDIHS